MRVDEWDANKKKREKEKINWRDDKTKKIARTSALRGDDISRIKERKK